MTGKTEHHLLILRKTSSSSGNFTFIPYEKSIIDFVKADYDSNTCFCVCITSDHCMEKISENGTIVDSVQLEDLQDYKKLFWNESRRQIVVHSFFCLEFYDIFSLKCIQKFSLYSRPDLRSEVFSIFRNMYIFAKSTNLQACDMSDSVQFDIKILNEEIIHFVPSENKILIFLTNSEIFCLWCVTQ